MAGGPSAVEVAAAPPPVDLGPELATNVEPYLRVDGTRIWSRLVDGGQVDAEQPRAPLQWRLLSRPTARTASGSLYFSLLGSRLGLLEDG